MGRYRPPRRRGARYITPAGAAALHAELEHLWHERRPEVVAALSAAAAEGDRSENAEYIYRKKQLAEIDRRARYLSRRIPSLKVAAGTPADAGAVFFGATLELEDTDTGAQRRYRIVGPDETDARRGWISIDSPLARAALRRRVDDAFAVDLPGGRVELVITAIRYGCPG